MDERRISLPRSLLRGLPVLLVVALCLLAAPVSANGGRGERSLKVEPGGESAESTDFRPEKDCGYEGEWYQGYTCIGEGEAALWVGGAGEDACTVDVEIDWGDGTKTSHEFDYPPGMWVNHSYEEPGIYRVTVTGRDLDAAGDSGNPGYVCIEGEFTFIFEVVPVLRFAGKAAERRSYLTDHSRSVLLDILSEAGLRSVTITSTYRTFFEQARTMYQNLLKTGEEAQKALYGPAGDLVIDEFVKARDAGKSKPQILELMAKKILQLGPCNISRHSCDPKTSHLNTIDIAPRSVLRKARFVSAVQADQRVACFKRPPRDPTAYHLEIPQPTGTPAVTPCTDR